MNICGHEISVCSWSLQPRDMGDSVGKLKQLGLDKVQIGAAGAGAVGRQAQAL